MNNTWAPSKTLYSESRPPHEFGDAARLIRDTLLLYRKGERVDALVREILKTDKATYEALHMLGSREGQRGNDAVAERLLRHALAINDASAETEHNLGLVLQHQGKLEEAIVCFRKATELQPGFAGAYCTLGKALQQQGNLPEARASYEKAIAQNPSFAKAYANYSICRKFTEEDRSLADRLETLLQSTMTEEDKCSLHYALGKIYGDRAMYDESFQHYLRANRIEHTKYPYNRQSFSKYVDRMIGAFPSGFYRHNKWAGSSSELPVFIIGMPRSGTTLIEQIISSHPLVFGAGELRYFNLKSHRLSQEGIYPYPECVETLSAEDLQKIAEEYLGYLRSFNYRAIRISDKLPGNFLHLGLISLLFPNARVIHSKRDPLDTSLSIFFQQFSANHPYASDLENLGHYYREYERLMKHWRSVLPPEMMLDLPYEETVEWPDRTSRKLIEFCGLEWDERCLQFHENTRVVTTASSWQVRQPIYTSSKERWKRYEKHLDPLKQALAGEEGPSA